MKLESLKSKKFEAFQESELQNAFKTIGGKPEATANLSKGCKLNDSMDWATRRSNNEDDVNMDADPNTSY